MAIKRIEYSAKEFGKLFQEKREFVLPKNTQLVLSLENVKLWSESKKLVGCSGDALKIVIGKFFAEALSPYQMVLEAFSTEGELSFSIDSDTPAFYLESSKELKISARFQDLVLSLNELCKRMTQEDKTSTELKIQPAQKIFIIEGNPAILAAAQNAKPEEAQELLKRAIVVPQNYHLEIQGSSNISLSPAVLEGASGLVSCVAMTGNEGLHLSLQRK